MLYKKHLSRFFTEPASVQVLIFCLKEWCLEKSNFIFQSRPWIIPRPEFSGLKRDILIKVEWLAWNMSKAENLEYMRLRTLQKYKFQDPLTKQNIIRKIIRKIERMVQI